MTKEFKGTPGPWTIDADNESCKQINGEFHAICLDQFCFAPEDEKEANAHLIAAAPELLEALTELLAALDLYLPSEPYETDGLLFRKARAAIAKALGEG